MQLIEMAGLFGTGCTLKERTFAKLSSKNFDQVLKLNLDSREWRKRTPRALKIGTASYFR